MGAARLWSILQRDPLSRGAELLRRGEPERAAEVFSRAGLWPEAVSAYLDAGDERKASAAAEKLGDDLRAGQLLAGKGAHRAALVFFDRCQAFWEAAEVSETIGQPLRSARYLQKAGALEKAAAEFARGGAIDEALSCLAMESSQLDERGDLENKRRVDLRRAKLLARCGQAEEAACLLESAGRHLLAAQLWQDAQRPDRAALALVAGGNAHRAAGLLEQAGDQLTALQRASILRAAAKHLEAADCYLEAGEREEAIASLVTAGNLRSAAELLEQVAEFGQAAALYARAGYHDRAAACWQEGGELGEAAEALLRAGRRREAAMIFRSQGEILRAAHELIKADDELGAVTILEEFDPGERPWDGAAVNLFFSLLCSNDRAAEVLKYLERGARSQALSQGDLFYWRGRAFEAAGRLGEALAEYVRVPKQSQHPDAQRRVAELRTRLGAGVGNDATIPLLRRDAEMVSVGDVLEDRFELCELLGRGGSAIVFRAVDRKTAQAVAIKVLSPKGPGQHAAEERLVNEVELCRRLDHPNIVKVHELGRHRGALFVSMELVEGSTLDRVLSEDGRFSAALTREILLDMLAGLAAAHAGRIVHRDLKPANVARTASGTKIMDFGIAQAEDLNLNLTQTGQVIGSPMYMAPEQIQGFKIDGRSDLYSLGVMTFTLLAGFEPFQGLTPIAISLKHLQDPPPDLATVRPDLAVEWIAFVSKLLNKEAALRYQTATEAAAAAQALPV